MLPRIKIPEASDLVRKRSDEMMTTTERGVLVTLLRDIEAKTVIEAGIHEGRCAEIMLLNVPSIFSYVGLDVEPGYQTSHPIQQTEIPEIPGRFVRDSLKFHLYTKLRGTLDMVPEMLPPCDAFIIDGDHGRTAVVWDTFLAEKLVRPGGLIIWHDYYPDDHRLDVTETLERFASEGKIIKHIEGTALAIRKV